MWVVVVTVCRVGLYLNQLDEVELFNPHTLFTNLLSLSPLSLMQLYINYKLKSVSHLPWRTMVYKALNTFIDDRALMACSK